MRQLDKVQNAIFLGGAFMMVIGVGCVVFGFMPFLMSIVFALGCVLFALMQMSQVYDGNSLTVKRLRRIMVLGDFCFIISGLMVVENVYKVLLPYFCTSLQGQMFYTQYIHNNWVLFLLIGAVVEIYTTHRIAYELKKEQREEHQ